MMKTISVSPLRISARVAVNKHRQMKTYGAINSANNHARILIDCIDCGVNPAMSGEKNNWCNNCVEKHRSRPKVSPNSANSVIQSLIARHRRADIDRRPAARRSLEAERTARSIRTAGRIFLLIVLVSLFAAAVAFVSVRETAKKRPDAKPAVFRKGGGTE